MTSAVRTAQPDPTDSAALDALCAALRGEDIRISTAVVETARQHDMHLVLALERRALLQDEGVGAALAAALREAAVTDLFRERELRRLLGRLAAAGVDTLLLKGAGLAYTVYSAPHARPRGDLDLLISRTDLETADQALAAGGWLRAIEQDNAWVTTQRHYVLEGSTPGAEPLDLHWNIAVPRVFAEAVVFGELLSRAIPITALGPHARTLSAPDALFLACLHRVAHHQDATDLLWLWDIHLLASSLSDAERAFFISLAHERSMRGVCARGLELAFARFATASAPALIEALGPAPGAHEEPSASFLRGGLRQIDVLQADLSVVGGWRARLAVIGAHLFPNARYMRSRYPRWPAAALPLTYLDRIVRGAPKWFRGPGG